MSPRNYGLEYVIYSSNHALGLEIRRFIIFFTDHIRFYYLFI